MSDYTFRVEMTHGQDMRHVDADFHKTIDGWLIFYRKSPQGGVEEYWRARIEAVVSIETRNNTGERP